MKKYYLLILFYCIGLNAQIINFPDADFKAKLLEASSSNSIASSQTPVYNSTSNSWSISSYNKIDTNDNGEIEISEAQVIKWLKLSESSIVSVAGIENFTNLIYLDCSHNQLSSLDVLSFPALQALYCGNNQLTSLNVLGLTNLIELHCNNNQLTNLNLNTNNQLKSLNSSGNPLTSINVDNNVELVHFYCLNNQLTNINLSNNSMLNDLNCSNNYLVSLNVTNCTSLTALFCNNNNPLTSIFMKNGSIESTFGLFFQNPNLRYVCADNSQLGAIQNHINIYGYNCHVNSYCTFAPGGVFYNIQGNSKVDSNNNGCDVSDMVLANLKFNIMSGTATGIVIANTSGDYSIPVQGGTHTLTPVLENPSYFNVFPANLVVDFPTQPSPFTQSFCIIPNGIHSDVEVNLLSIEIARPGFDAKYKLVYKNKGNQIENGSLNVSFNDGVLDLVSANPLVTNQTINNLSWSFTNLLPFETREISFTLNVNSPVERQ